MIETVILIFQPFYLPFQVVQKQKKMTYCVEQWLRFLSKFSITSVQHLILLKYLPLFFMHLTCTPFFPQDGPSIHFSDLIGNFCDSPVDNLSTKNFRIPVILAHVLYLIKHTFSTVTTTSINTKCFQNIEIGKKFFPAFNCISHVYLMS